MIQIMIVDDHALVREGYIRLINSDRRFKVIGSAKSGEDAVSQLNKISPDVLITDMSMPGMSGLSVIVNALALHPNLKIILCSMHETLHIVNAAIAAGAKGFVSKSSDPRLILEAITKVHKNKTYLCDDILREIDKGQISLEQLRLESLTISELETFRKLAEGLSVRQISEKLNLAEKTINNYQTQIRQKLKLETSAQLVHYAYRNKLILSDI
jgi:DNA-binding NarL/FixJ family response regulator